MPFKHHKDALIEAAASGAEPQGELRAHLESCASCRAAFAEEQALFASIDAGLHATVNAEVPASLLPRVRARLDEAVAPRRRWMQPLIFAAASVALALVVFLATRLHPGNPEHQARQVPVIPSQETAATGTRHETPGSNTLASSARSNRLRTARTSDWLHSAPPNQPEVLVPPDEREAFAHLVAKLQERSDVVFAVLVSEKNDAPLSMDPLQIKDLEIKPLEGRVTEVSDRTEAKH